MLRMIYQDPISERREEGQAEMLNRLLKYEDGAVGEDERGRYSLQTWIVRFPEGCFVRRVRHDLPMCSDFDGMEPFEEGKLP